MYFLVGYLVIHKLTSVNIQVYIWLIALTTAVHQGPYQDWDLIPPCPVLIYNKMHFVSKR